MYRLVEDKDGVQGKRKAVGEEIKEGEGSKGTAARDEKASTSESASSGDRLQGESRSKRREDLMLLVDEGLERGGEQGEGC